MKSISIYLDDERPTPIGYRRTFSVAETCKLLQECCCKGIVVDVLSLDNYLGPGCPQGKEVADWLKKKVFEENFPIPEYLRAHTSDVEAYRYMNRIFIEIYSKVMEDD